MDPCRRFAAFAALFALTTIRAAEAAPILKKST
jgi:hypothetical protein